MLLLPATLKILQDFQLSITSLSLFQKQHAARRSHDRELPPYRDNHLSLHTQTPGVAVQSLGGH